MNQPAMMATSKTSVANDSVMMIYPVKNYVRNPVRNPVENYVNAILPVCIRQKRGIMHNFLQVAHDKLFIDCFGALVAAIFAVVHGLV